MKKYFTGETCFVGRKWLFNCDFAIKKNIYFHYIKYWQKFFL